MGDSVVLPGTGPIAGKALRQVPLATLPCYTDLPEEEDTVMERPTL
jgi:hypothetical protein